MSRIVERFPNKMQCPDGKRLGFSFRLRRLFCGGTAWKLVVSNSKKGLSWGLGLQVRRIVREYQDKPQQSLWEFVRVRLTDVEREVNHTRPNVPHQPGILSCCAQNRELRDTVRPTCRKGIDEIPVRFPITTRKILDVRAIMQQPVRCGRHDKRPDLLELGLPSRQGGHEGPDDLSPL